MTDQGPLGQLDQLLSMFELPQTTLLFSIRPMKIRHTVIFTFYETATNTEIEEVITRLNEMGAYLQKEVGATEWVLARHLPETFKAKRAHLLQDGVFPSLEALRQHGSSERTNA